MFITAKTRRKRVLVFSLPLRPFLLPLALLPVLLPLTSNYYSLSLGTSHNRHRCRRQAFTINYNSFLIRARLDHEACVCVLKVVFAPSYYLQEGSTKVIFSLPCVCVCSLLVLILSLCILATTWPPRTRLVQWRQHHQSELFVIELFQRRK